MRLITRRSGILILGLAFCSGSFMLPAMAQTPRQSPSLAAPAVHSGAEPRLAVPAIAPRDRQGNRIVAAPHRVIMDNITRRQTRADGLRYRRPLPPPRYVPVRPAVQRRAIERYHQRREVGRARQR